MCFSQQKHFQFVVILLSKMMTGTYRDNDRPISFLSRFGKLMERIILKHVYDFLLDRKLIYKNHSARTLHSLSDYCLRSVNPLKMKS